MWHPHALLDLMLSYGIPFDKSNRQVAIIYMNANFRHVIYPSSIL
jgi:hypothetical protein